MNRTQTQLFNAYRQCAELRNDLKRFDPDSLNYQFAALTMRTVRDKISRLERLL